MKPSPSNKKPEHLDIVISHGSHPATGPFDVVIDCDGKGELKLYPLLFLDEDDLSFKILKTRVSGSLVPSSIFPVGKLKLVWKKDI
jgi:hypothetical protein